MSLSRTGYNSMKTGDGNPRAESKTLRRNSIIRSTRILAGLALVVGFDLVMTGKGHADDCWDLASDTWVATDGLGRRLPLAEKVGPPRRQKYVGVFYFLWLGQSGDRGPFDISKILARDPAAIRDPKSPLWGPELAPHHWGESIFGYYTSDDDSVLRKHAQMLADAGVDTIVFDVTNQVTYAPSWKALCRVLDRVKRQGNRVPQIAFLCPFGDPRKVVREPLGRPLQPRSLSRPLVSLEGQAADPGRPRALRSRHRARPARHARRQS